jgi:16S rRNA (guanine527-N7)-methyltransferase
MDYREFSEKYFEFLNGPLAGINLTAIKDKEEFYNKQILDSLYPFIKIENLRNLAESKMPFIDIGFGGGFPLVPLAFLYPEKQFIGIESKNKKIKAVSQICEYIGLNNVSFAHERFENIDFDTECLITNKAVTTIENLLGNIEYSAPIQVVFYKGPNLYDLERSGMEKVKGNWDIFIEKEVEVPQTENRFILGYKNRHVPRGTLKNRKKLIKLTDILKNS